MDYRGFCLLGIVRNRIIMHIYLYAHNILMINEKSFGSTETELNLRHVTCKQKMCERKGRCSLNDTLGKTARENFNSGKISRRERF